MKVYLAAVADYVPNEICLSIRAYTDFCFITRQAEFNDKTLEEIRRCIRDFNQAREIFREAGIRSNFNLPRQHSITHFPDKMMDFGAPNGLCSTITESRHITAVKKPWRRSNRYEALGQMLLTNQRLDKLSALRNDFVERGMLPSTQTPLPPPRFEDNGEVEEAPVDENVSANVELARTPGKSIIYSNDCTLGLICVKSVLIPETLRLWACTSISHYLERWLDAFYLTSSILTL